MMRWSPFMFGCPSLPQPDVNERQNASISSAQTNEVPSDYTRTEPRPCNKKRDDDDPCVAIVLKHIKKIQKDLNTHSNT